MKETKNTLRRVFLHPILEKEGDSVCGRLERERRTVNLEYVAIFFRKASVAFRTNPAAVPILVLGARRTPGNA